MLNKQIMVDADNALAGRQEAMAVEPVHFVNGSDITAPATQGQQEILLGMGCFWGAERLFWQLDGVVSTSVGYSGGFTLNPTYQEVCSGQTGHTEVVRVIFDPQVLPLEQLLEKFWERHDPTQGMRQGNDLGTQYRSAIYTFSDQQLDIALASQQAYQAALANQQHNTHHHRDPPCWALLLRGNLPPAIFGQKSRRLLWSRRYRCVLSASLMSASKRSPQRDRLLSMPKRD